MKNGLCLILILIGFYSFGQEKDSLLNQYFFESGLAIQDTSGLEVFESYDPSGSYWAIDSFSEETVFHRAMMYTDASDSLNSYALRIGKGGHIYSMIGAFGESVPPQYRPQQWVQDSYGGGTSYAPWVDEVWQMVSVDGTLNNPPDSSYFIHQSGVYLKTPNQTQPFFSPILSEFYDADKQSYSIINWGQQAHTEDLLNVDHRSGLLYYSKYTHIGHGIIEVDQMIYNFGADNMNFINVPWGGVRNSNLDHFFISNPTNEFSLANAVYGQGPVVQTGSTGGWMGWSDQESGDSPALIMVHPTSTVSNNNVFRYGSAGANPSNPRDYNVFEMIRFPAAGQLDFGKCMSFRYYYVFAGSVDAAREKILNLDLSSFAMDASFTPPKEEVGSLHYQFDYQDGQFYVSLIDTLGSLELRQSPFLNSYPVFRITAFDGSEYISTDPYHLSTVPYDGQTLSLDLLGFYDKPMVLSVQSDTVCAGDSYNFPDGAEVNDVQEPLVYISTLTANAFEGDSLIVSRLEVSQIDNTVIQAQDSLIAVAEDVFYQWLDCLNDYAAIQGDTFMTFMPGQSGSFAAQISNLECVDTSSCIQFIPTNTHSKSITSSFTVFPNPSEGSFVLQTNKSFDPFISQLYNASGQLIESCFIKDERDLYFNLDLPSGYYILKLNCEGYSDQYLKIIIE